MELSEQFAVLTRGLLKAATVGEVLEQVLEAAMTLIPEAALASVTLRAPDGTFYTPVETDELGTELDLIQYATGQGPCVDAARPDGPAYATSDDLHSDEQWPRFSTAASSHGLGAVLSTELLPAPGDAQLQGALNVYSRHRHGLTDTDQAVALLLATHAALALALAHSHTRQLAELHCTQLRAAIESRDVIGQAKGILMARRGLSADDAFDLLRRTSQDLNVKLVELARTLTDRHTDLDI